MLVEVSGLTKIYNTGKISVVALDDVNLGIDGGEFVAVMGPSGSGKTTFMNLLGCLDRPSSGAYTLAGQEVEKLNDNQLAGIRNTYIGFVFQSFNLLRQLSAQANVELPLLYSGASNRHQQALEALERVGIADRAHHKPNELSGGQQQRVAIARALVTKPSLILADEPTGNLDSKTGVEILNLFDKLNKEGTTIVMVTHDPKVGERAHRVVSFVDGKVVDDKKNGSAARAHEASVATVETTGEATA